jgi:rhamnogalacturonyl hydrolase YesR
VIIDNMMNLELLFWASNQTGNNIYKDVAIKHAETTIENHFRDDNSSYHVVSYFPKTGLVEKKETHQGCADSSAWARGQVWGLYGFTVCYRETKDVRFLNQAEKIAGFIMNHPNMPKDLIPYWDFNAPKIPDEPRDASAAAIMASALLELSELSENGNIYYNYAETILRNLSAEVYLAKKGENNGFVLKHCVGNYPAGTEIDAPLNYADYYYLEAMVRYLRLKKQI